MEGRTETVATYRTGKATVRIHQGKMTEEERKTAFEAASRKMRMEMGRKGEKRREKVHGRS